MNAPLSQLHCEPCRSGGEALSEAEARDLLRQIPAWSLTRERERREKGTAKLFRKFGFVDFDEAFGFSGRVAALAREQDHHPAMLVEYGKVEICWWTHAINGLHLNDFIMAAKTDDIFGEMTGVRN